MSELLIDKAVNNTLASKADEFAQGRAAEDESKQINGMQDAKSVQC